jgi:ferritin
VPISDAMTGALNAQIGRELEAHLQYLQISSYFDSEALPALTDFFAEQADEEHQHAMKFRGYLQDQGAQVAIPSLAAPRAGFETAEEAVQLSLTWETEVTGHINDIVSLARTEDDHATFSFLQWFVDEQVEEVSTMSDMLTVVQRAGEAKLLDVDAIVARGEFGGDD